MKNSQTWFLFSDNLYSLGKETDEKQGKLFQKWTIIKMFYWHWEGNMKLDWGMKKSTIVKIEWALKDKHNFNFKEVVNVIYVK